MLKDADCNSCKPGFVFDKEGNCVSCQVDKPERCYTCDPLNRKKCLLCNPGYYHNENGGCSHPDDFKKEESEEEYADGEKKVEADP